MSYISHLFPKLGKGKDQKSVRHNEGWEKGETFLKLNPVLQFKTFPKKHNFFKDCSFQKWALPLAEKVIFSTLNFFTDLLV